MTEVVEAVESMPVNMPGELSQQIAKPEVQKASDDIMGPGTHTILGRPTVNIGTIRGGLKVNMIPATCSSELDIRLPAGLTREHVLELIGSIIPKYKEAKIELSIHEAHSNPSSFSQPSHPMVGLLAKNAKLVAPETDEPVPILSIGATDCKHYRYRGIPAYVYGCSPKTSKSTTTLAPPWLLRCTTLTWTNSGSNERICADQRISPCNESARGSHLGLSAVLTRFWDIFWEIEKYFA
jgi:acetylornithine deacetylase/succinyl-diaminopimelate desuccinylase-like protein